VPNPLVLIDAYTQLSDKLSDLAGSPASMPLDGLRLLERKTATVCTLLKASVYSIVLQQQIWNENEEQQQQQQNEDQQFQDQDYQYEGYEGEGDMTFQ
jgi:DASH complex subunit DAD3